MYDDEMTNLPTVSETLIGASKLIKNAPRLAIGSFKEPTGAGMCYCAMGAIREFLSFREVDGDTERSIRLVEANTTLADILGAKPGDDYFVVIADWNDSQQTTQKQVAKAMKLAGKVAELREAA